MALVQTRLFGPKVAQTTELDDDDDRYLVPSGKTVILKQIIICNSSNSVATVSVAVGSTSTVGNRIISQKSIPPTDTVCFNCNLVLSAGEKLFFLASTSSVTFTANGIVE